MFGLSRKNIVTLLIVIATIVLAGVAIFTAIRLYQLRQQAVAPTAPEQPGAQAAPTVTSCQALTFTLAAETPQCYSGTCTTNADCPTGLACQDRGGTTGFVCVDAECPTDTNCVCDETITYSCNSDCTNTPQCETANADYVCDTTSDKCRLESNPASTTCAAAAAGPTPTPTPGPTATPGPELPEAGVSTPTIVGAGFGVLLLLGALLLAL